MLQTFQHFLFQLQNLHSVNLIIVVVGRIVFALPSISPYTVLGTGTVVAGGEAGVNLGT